MQYSYISAAFLALATSVFAQTSGFDVITKPTSGEVVPAGSTYSITWTPSGSAGTVSLILLQGASNTTLQLGDTIASGLTSTSGSYSWSVPTTLTSYKVFGVKLQLDSDTSTFQYSNPFSISGLASTSVSSVSGASTVTRTISQVSTPIPTTTSSAAATIDLNTTASSSSSTATTMTTMAYTNSTSTTAVASSSSGHASSTTASRTATTTSKTSSSTTASATSTANAAAGLVAGSGAGLMAVAAAFFL